MYLCARGIDVACERSCICVLGESMLFVVMYLCVRGNVVTCERSCICVLGESLLHVSGHVFVC